MINKLFIKPFFICAHIRYWLLGIAIFTCYTYTFAQNTDILSQPITLKLHNVPLKNALDSISQKTEMYFTYNSALINKDKNIQISCTNYPLKSVLKELLNDSTLSFYVLKKQIIIARYTPNENLSELDDQSKNSFINITGKVFDINTGEALSFVNLGIAGKYKGTTTNAEGIFNMMLSPQNFSDTLQISYIGYHSAKIPISEIVGHAQFIALQQNAISLQEIIIRSTDPLALVKGALANFDENYLQIPANFTSFYRESVQKNKNYMIYIESILDVYKASYRNSDSELDVAKIYKSRKIDDVNRLDTISFRLQGGIEGCFQMDVIKNAPTFLDEKYFANYNYTLSDINTYNNGLVYIIDCEPKKEVKEPLLYGRLFIEASNLAIIRAEFNYPPQVAEKLSNQLITKKKPRVKVKPLVLDYAVSYRNLNGKYYLNHSIGNLKFKVRDRKNLFSNTFSIQFEMATTNIDTVNVHRIKYKERIHPNVILSRENLEYDAEFWGNQSFIQPEESISDALKRIDAKITQSGNVTPE